MTFMQNKLDSHDAILVRVVSTIAQKVVAIPERVYSSRFGGLSGYGTDPIQFTGAPGHWGNATLDEGEQAIVLLRDLGYDRGIYQDAWHGHFSVVEINGAPHAVAHWDLLSSGGWEPAYLYESAFPLVPGQHNKTAMPLHLLERHIHDLVGDSVTSTSGR